MLMHLEAPPIRGVMETGLSFLCFSQIIGYIGAIFELGAILVRHFLLIHIFGLWFETNKEHKIGRA